MDEDEFGSRRRGLLGAVLVAQVFGISVVGTMAAWLANYLGGFAWDGTTKKFNAHPLSMAIGLIYLYGTAILVYRLFPNATKIHVKVLHAGLLMLALVGAVVGLTAVIEFHNSNLIANLYSLHSWCGLITLILFFLQYLIGFVFFLFPGLRNELRALYLPVHRYFGGAILTLAGITAISGINEKLFFLKNYQKLYPSALLGNFCGVLIVIFIVLVLFIVQKSTWQRPALNVDDDATEHMI